MRKKIHLRKKLLIQNKNRTSKKSTKFIYATITVIILVCLSFYYLNKKTSPVLVNYAQTEIKKLSNLIINRAISKQMTEELNFDNLFIIDKNSSGEINTIDFNPTVVNKVLSTCTSTVQLNLKYVEDGKLDMIDVPDPLISEYQNNDSKNGVIFRIPSGIIFGNSLLSNLGPKIPVRLNLVGNIESSINTKITDYGINNALVEVFVKISVNEQVILPFISKTITVTTNIPVAIKIISGKIPNTFFNNSGQSTPTFTIPAS